MNLGRSKSIVNNLEDLDCDYFASSEEELLNVEVDEAILPELY